MDLLPLSDYNRRASLGNDYNELKIMYPDWSNDLHKYGHYLTNDKLELIATEGIIRWYLKESTPFDIDYNYFDILYFYENPEKISYYDMIAMIKMSKMNGIECFMDDLKYNTKYEFMIKNKIDSIYFTRKFGYYLCQNYDKQSIITFVKKLYSSIRFRRDYFMMGSFYEYFLYTYPHIKKWGIIFQKYKIILEKITILNHQNIYKTDMFVENIQQYIYTLIIKYIENFMISDKSIIILENQEKFNNEKYLKYYKNLKNFI